MMQMQQKTGYAQDCPDMFAAPVIIALVAEDASGEVVTGIYMEAVAELTMLNFHREAYNSAEALLPILAGIAYERKIRLGKVATLHRIRRRVERMLTAVGFFPESERMDHWIFRVRD